MAGPTDYAATSGNTPAVSSSPAARPGMEVHLDQEMLDRMGHGKNPPTVGMGVGMGGEVIAHTQHPDGKHHIVVHLHQMHHDGMEKKSMANRVYGGKETASEERKEAAAERK